MEICRSVGFACLVASLGCLVGAVLTMLLSFRDARGKSVYSVFQVSFLLDFS